MSFSRKLTVEVCVYSVLQKSSRSKVNKFELERFQVDKKVFILNVSVDYPFPVAGKDCLDNLKRAACYKLSNRQRWYVVKANFLRLNDENSILNYNAKADTA